MNQMKNKKDTVDIRLGMLFGYSLILKDVHKTGVDAVKKRALDHLKDMDDALQGKFVITKLDMNMPKSLSLSWCDECVKDWGEIGLCKKHTKIHTIKHMGFKRWLKVWTTRLAITW